MSSHPLCPVIAAATEVVVAVMHSASVSIAAVLMLLVLVLPDVERKKQREIIKRLCQIEEIITKTSNDKF